MAFVVISWVLGFTLAILFISNGVARFSGDRLKVQRKNRIGVDDSVFGLVAWVEVVAGVGLVLSSLYGPPDTWPALFSGPLWFAVGLASAFSLIVIRAFAIWLGRDVYSKFDDSIPSLILILLCIAYLIAFTSRQILFS